MLQNLEDTASALIHYRARTVIDENRGKHRRAHNASNPRLGKEAKLVVFPSRTAQDLVINPITGGYDLTGCKVYISKPTDIIDLTKDNSNMDTVNTNTDINIETNTNENT